LAARGANRKEENEGGNFEEKEKNTTPLDKTVGKLEKLGMEK